MPQQLTILSTRNTVVVPLVLNAAAVSSVFVIDSIVIRLLRLIPSEYK